jgi:hypothetical protein
VQIELAVLLLATTAVAHKCGFTKKQIAFIGAFHGAAQGVVAEELKSKSCEVTNCSKIMEMVQRSPNKNF